MSDLQFVCFYDCNEERKYLEGKSNDLDQTHLILNISLHKELFTLSLLQK